MKHYSELVDDQCTTVTPSAIVGLMTGCLAAKQNNTGLVKLVYSDYSEQVAVVDFDIATEPSFFKIVGAVQDKANN